MTDAVRITIHDQECVFSPSYDQMRRVVTGSSRFLPKIGVPIFLFKIFHPPRAPKRFQLLFREFGHIVQLEASLQTSGIKSSGICIRIAPEKHNVYDNGPLDSTLQSQKAQHLAIAVTSRSVRLRARSTRRVWYSSIPLPLVPTQGILTSQG